MSPSASLILVLAGFSVFATGQDRPEDSEEVLPLAPIGGIPIEVVIDVSFDFREAIGGDELQAYEGGWIHTQEGRLLPESGWLAHHDQIDDARGAGRDVCWYDWGQPAGTPHWTLQWSSELILPEPMRRASPASRPLPPIHVDVDGADALVIYAPPREFAHWHPGSPDDCQNADPVPAHQRTTLLLYDLDQTDVARPPGARDAVDVVIQDGIVLLRIPLDRLSAGTAETNEVNLHGSEGDVDWGLRIGVKLTSSPSTP